MRLLTIDSSVYVSAARPSERGHEASKALFSWLRAARPRILLPTLALTEVAAALGRTGSTPTVALEYTHAIANLPGTLLVPLDEPLALAAAELGAVHGLRGADAVFVATAALFSSELLTWDREQLERGALIVTTLAPPDLLEDHHA